MRIKFSLTHADKAQLFGSKEEAASFAAANIKSQPYTISHSEKYDKYFIAQYEKGQLIGILEKQNA